MPTLTSRLADLDRRFPLRTVAVADQRFSYRSCGRGEVCVVLLHGIGSSSASWMDFALALTAQQPQIQVIAWDAPGYGNSSPLATPRPLAHDYGTAFALFLASIDLPAQSWHLVLVGHSLGCLMTAAYCAQHAPPQLQQAFFLSPATGYGRSDAAAERARVYQARIQALEQLGIAEIARLRSPRLVGAQASQTVLDWVQWNMSKLNPQGYRQAVEMLCAEDLTRFAPLPPTLPLQVYSGSADVVTPEPACRAIAESFHSPYTRIDAVGHAMHMEAAAPLAATLGLAIHHHLTQHSYVSLKCI